MVRREASDFGEHVRTYEAFLSLTKWAVGTVICVLALMGLFLVRH